MSIERPPNSHECTYFGRKMSSYITDHIDRTEGFDIVIGSDCDDEIYFGECLEGGEEMIRGRVTVAVMGDDLMIDIDLEDLLRFAAENCRGIYDRIADEVAPSKWRDKL